MKSRRIDKQLTDKARALRNEATPQERALWNLLSRYRPKFTRQLSLKPYVADLACRQAKLIVELDGSQHADSEYDLERTRTSKHRAGPSSASGTARWTKIPTALPKRSC